MVKLVALVNIRHMALTECENSPRLKMTHWYDRRQLNYTRRIKIRTARRFHKQSEDYVHQIIYIILSNAT